MKVSALFNDTHSREDADRHKRPREAHECARAHFFKITQKYWKCTESSVIMSLSCIARCIVNYNYSENSLIKWG